MNESNQQRDKLDIPLFNIRIIKNYVEYFREYCPEVDINTLLKCAGITSYQLEDGGHWLTQRQVNLFHEGIERQTKMLDIPKKVGRHATLSQTLGPVRQFTVGFLTPSTAYMLIEKFFPHLSRAHTVQARSLGSNKVELIFSTKPGIEEKLYQCENRTGMFEAIAKLFTNKFGIIEHPTCMHRGGHHCRYIISWEKTPSLIWKRVRNYIALSSFVVCPAILILLRDRQLAGIIFVFLYLLFVLIIFFYSENVEKKELALTLKNQGDLANTLLDEINIRYNNAMLVHEIGQASSNILDIDKLLKFTMDTVEKRLDFDRGAILLADKTRTNLLYTAGFGYNPTDEDFVKKTGFHLDNPKSKAPFAIAFKNQKSFLVNNISDVEKDISDRTRNFIKQIGVSSFICVPIVYEGKSEGVLAVDNFKSTRILNQSDLNLLSGVALQIGISINNARSYQLVLEREQRFRALSENAPDIIYTINVDGIFSYVNPSWERILGHTKEEVIGNYFMDFVKKEDIDHFKMIFEKIKNRKELAGNIECTILHKDGSERIFNISGAPNLDVNGNVIGIVGIFKDISEQKKLESKLLHAQKMEAIGTLAGGIAHDFNNLLTGIHGYASLMFLDINVCHPLYEKLKGIEDQVRSGAELTKQLLGLARGGKYEVTVADLNEIIDKTSVMFGRTKKEISVHRKYEKDIWAVEIDRGQIEQALLNMYVNAWQAMPGGGDLYLETANVILDEEFVKPFYVPPGKYVKVSITDTGIGMDEKTKERIFDPFFTTKEMGRGTGLGLSSAYGIIKGHNGIIHVSSDKGQGATFCIYLPASEKKIIEQEKASEDIVKGEGGILLVDDEDVITDVGKEILELLGYRVFIAKSGQEAIEIYNTRREEIDLVILDMIMPGMGGGETFDVLKSINPRIKIILSSGYSIDVRPIKMLDQGCDGFIQKPYSMNTLSQKVKEVLNKNI